jgi:hypothetical protein
MWNTFRYTMVFVKVGDEETVELFVLRARRVEAHSLVRDEDALAGFAAARFSVQLSVDSEARVSYTLPPSEEVFESLVARLRPVLLSTEPIYYDKVLSALERLLGASPADTAELRGDLAVLRVLWESTALGSQVQAYLVMAAKPDGSESTGPVPDTVMADGWLYADLVHASPHGQKAKALSFSLTERYSAAVGVFSRLAMLTVITLRLIERARDTGVLSVDQQSWDDEVVITATEIELRATLYTAEPDTEMPDFPDPISRPGGPWQRLTVTNHVRMNPASRVRIELIDPDGAVRAEYGAAAVGYRRDGDVLHWRVLVEDCLILRVQFRVAQDGHLTPLVLKTKVASPVHRVALAAARVELCLLDANRVTLHVHDGCVGTASPDDGEGARQLVGAKIDYLQDVLELEKLSERIIDPFAEVLSPTERMRLRQIRLLWQGEVVQWDRVLPLLVSKDGSTTNCFVMEPSTLAIGGAEIPIPEVYLGHPEATWQLGDPAPEIGPDARLLTATVPDGVRFLAWAPSLRSAPADQMPDKGRRWHLADLDQDTAPY